MIIGREERQKKMNRNSVPIQKNVWTIVIAEKLLGEAISQIVSGFGVIAKL